MSDFRSKTTEGKVILVATRNELLKLATKAEAEATVGSLLKNNPAFFPLFNFGEISSKIYANHLMSKHENMSDEQLIGLIDKYLDLGVSPNLVSPSEAVLRFKFEVGHTPRDGSIYIQHPVLEDVYIDPADFSRTVSKEKEAAFRQLASSLGAKNLTLVNATFKKTKGFFGAKASIPDAATDVGIKVVLERNGAFVKKVYSEYGSPRRKPCVPADLQRWVDIDPDLRTMARDRIDGHLLKSTVTLEFKEGIGIGGELAAKIASKGFGISGSYQAISHTVWHFDVEYYPINE